MLRHILLITFMVIVMTASSTATIEDLKTKCKEIKPKEAADPDADADDAGIDAACTKLDEMAAAGGACSEMSAIQDLINAAVEDASKAAVMAIETALTEGKICADNMKCTDKVCMASAPTPTKAPPGGGGGGGGSTMAPGIKMCGKCNGTSCLLPFMKCESCMDETWELMDGNCTMKSTGSGGSGITEITSTLPVGLGLVFFFVLTILS